MMRELTRRATWMRKLKPHDAKDVDSWIEYWRFACTHSLSLIVSRPPCSCHPFHCTPLLPFCWHCSNQDILQVTYEQDRNNALLKWIIWAMFLVTMPFLCLSNKPAHVEGLQQQVYINPPHFPRTADIPDPFLPTTQNTTHKIHIHIHTWYPTKSANSTVFQETSQTLLNKTHDQITHTYTTSISDQICKLNGVVKALHLPHRLRYLTKPAKARRTS